MASPAYIAARGTPEPVEALANHDCLTLPQPSGSAVWRLDGPGGEIEVQVAGRFSANTAYALLKAALAGLGIALLPAPVTAPHVSAGELIEVLPEHGVNGRDAYLVYLSRRQLPRAVSAFIEFMVAKMVGEGFVRPASAHRASG